MLRGVRTVLSSQRLEDLLPFDWPMVVEANAAILEVVVFG